MALVGTPFYKKERKKQGIGENPLLFFGKCGKILLRRSLNRKEGTAMEQQQNRQDPVQSTQIQPPSQGQWYRATPQNTVPQGAVPKKSVQKDPMIGYVWASLMLGGVGLCCLLFACIGWLLVAGVLGIVFGLLAASFGFAYLRSKEADPQGNSKKYARLGLTVGIVVLVLAVAALVLGILFPTELDAFFKALMQPLTEVA